MKKIISLVLVLVMVLGLCACGASTGAEKNTAAPTEAAASFMAGFGKADITPTKYGIPMGGYGNEAVRLSTGLLSYIYAICVAVTDEEGNTALMMSADMCSLGLSVCTEVRNWASLEYGIPTENIIISSIHQHSTPISTAGDYAAELLNGMKDAIKQAMEDRAPAEMYINKVETVAMSFVRRYWLNDGGFLSSHSCTGDKASGIAGYETESDKEMRLVKFVRGDETPIIMVNFQGHPHMGTNSSDTNIHSDWPGVMRDVVTEELGAHCIYFSGAGGNMNSSSSIKEDMISKDFREHGQRAAEYVIGAEDSYTKAETGKIVCVEETQTYKADHSLDYLLSVAQIVQSVRSTEGMAAAHTKVKEFPELNSAYQASAICNKAALGETKDLTYTVITFGDMAMSGHPYEMFDNNGKELRDGTVGNEYYDEVDQLENPYAMTFVATIANAAEGYIPSYYGFSNGGYERDTTRYAQGTGELIVGDVLHLLNELHK